MRDRTALRSSCHRKAAKTPGANCDHVGTAEPAVSAQEPRPQSSIHLQGADGERDRSPS